MGVRGGAEGAAEGEMESATRRMQRGVSQLLHVWQLPKRPNGESHSDTNVQLSRGLSAS